ncbi:beta-hexosaminidase-like [Acropora millepora]|uniref:beta-hexosaminidase-like n=1 Tax=Acropora millepora TaxID=45264 RepID=UPI001CF28093|nr:beta-hexosaminidase-like [Acropora millepora]XP_029179490.2 beta-hexosaminidase-like [Acropora millepora]XP_044181245.1 beta-hexosaminidase-like [Acropora millepora]XP_044181246.1 beta-hexosaminidase-like [Acropora millepora]XP_044181247.1 beta-hexosaminidase-like [Acropora millepora]XP_044181249.1 beta-hexosaminidase-like [Acropora millepora]XP_044181250.1 beta-hexosaminidase-like [Acropora millepora]
MVYGRLGRSVRGRIKLALQVLLTLLILLGVNRVSNNWKQSTNILNTGEIISQLDGLLASATINVPNFGSDNRDNLRENFEFSEAKHEALGDQETLDYLAKAITVYFNFLSDEEAEIIFTNNGPRVIENFGWAVYVSSMLSFSPVIDNFEGNGYFYVDKVLRVSHVSGRLFKLRPMGSHFKILPGESARCKVRTSWKPSRFLVAPNWYIARTGLRPRTIASTVGEELKFVAYPKWLQEKVHAITADFGHAPLAVIPTPKELRAGDHSDAQSSTVFISKEWTVIADDRLQNERRFLSDKLGLKATNHFTGIKSKVILLNLTSSTHALATFPESYVLKVDNSKEMITITGHGTAGVFYGMQTLLSLLNSESKVPEVLVKDWPRFSYRGLMIDVARNFKSKHQILKTLDVMAMYKMNKLHLHLSDSEGWRLEIPGLEELTTVGARRCHDLQEKTCLLSHHGSGPDISSFGTGYYSTEDYRDILRHAHQRHVQVIPEFDFPGHSHAAIQSMKVRHEGLMVEEKAQYSLLIDDFQDVSQYVSAQGFREDVINPCLASTYSFMDYLISALLRLHRDIQPLKLFHFGGDEVPLGVWIDSPACKNMTQKLERNKPMVRQSLMIHFVKKLSTIAKKHNVEIAGWSDAFTFEDNQLDEMSEQYILSKTLLDSKDPVAYYWGGGKDHWRAQTLTDDGYKMVLSPSEILYLDHSSEDGFNERGLNWAADYSNVKKILNFSPADNENILGIEGTAWSELIRTADQLDSMIFPRLLAVAERAWNKAPWADNAEYAARQRAIDSEWVNFANTLGYKELKRLDLMGVAYRIPPPEPRLSCKKENCKKLRVTTELPGLKTEYSLDNGVTWKDTTPQMELNTSMKFRTRSPDGTRFSRVITLEPLVD